MIAYPPLTVLRLKKLWPHARRQGHERGEIWRVGYYSKQDGLECIWLVDKKGEYCWTADAKWISEVFEVVRASKEKDVFGLRRPQMRSLSPTELRQFMKA
jgi:hypothetical protein